MTMGRKNKKDIVADRRSVVAKLYLQGMWQTDIAAQVGVTQQQVSKDLVIIREKWKQSTISDYSAKVDEELAKINLLEQEYYDAWNRSKKEFVSKSTKRRKPADSKTYKISEKQKKVEERNGNPQYLQGVQWCIDQRCKILGIPAKLPTQPLEHSFDLSGLTMEQLQVLEAVKTKTDVAGS